MGFFRHLSQRKPNPFHGREEMMVTKENYNIPPPLSHYLYVMRERIGTAGSPVFSVLIK